MIEYIFFGKMNNKPNAEKTIMQRSRLIKKSRDN